MGLLEVIALCGALQAPIDIAQTNGQGISQKQCQEAHASYKEKLSTLNLTIDDKDALIRIIEAEASDQGDIGQAYVLFVVLNRTIHKDFPSNVQAVINEPNQFEPATTAKGWHNLRPVQGEKAAKIKTMINLATSGTMPDPTGGALYFQNIKTVAKREEKGTVSKGLTGFNGSTPKATINDHTFYTSIKSGTTKPKTEKKIPDKWDIFSEENQVKDISGDGWDAFEKDKKKQSWDAF